MHYLLDATAVLAMFCNVLATLTAVVFCLAMAANAQPAQIWALKIWILGLSLVGIAGLTISYTLIQFGQSTWAIVAATGITASTLVLGLFACLK